MSAALAEHAGENRLASVLVWGHGVLYASAAVVCYLAPRAVFGDTAWLPLAGLAVGLFAAALLALAVLMMGCARIGTIRHIRLALLAALILDIQVPILMGLFPASLEHFQVSLGMPWFLVPVAFIVIAGATVYCTSSMPAQRGSS
jgi:hypothetical protein